MKMNLRTLSVLTMVCTFSFTACKKDNTPTSNTNQETELKAHAEDQSSVSADLDDVANDANIALESNASFGGRLQSGQNTNSICGGTAVADTVSNPRTITITYNGANCTNTHFRTGTVVLSMPSTTRWRNAGAAITVTYQNLKVKRLRDNKSITINGSQVITNVSGGLLLQLASVQQIVHTITGNNLSITFDDNTQRTWQVARKRVFTYNNGAVMTVHGIGTNGTITNAAEWGTNRFGNAFTTSITQPLVVRQDCNFRLTEGEVKHQGFATATATFGLNANGAQTTCPAGTYYYKLTWTGPGGNSASVILPY
jgi:hypothetical protein